MSVDAEVRALEERLRCPEPDENGYASGSVTYSRLDALRRLAVLAAAGSVPPAERRGGVNTHIHTAKSFSFFASPTDAAWKAFRAGVDVFGINDHYTLCGHDEFREACVILGIQPMFSMEAVATWEEALAASAAVNDPVNPGRTYLTAKGVTRALAERSSGARDLRRMKDALAQRNQEITRRVAMVATERLGVESSIDWAAVLGLTPHGEPTERHVCEATALFLAQTYPEGEERRVAASKLLADEVPAVWLDDAAKFQNAIRARLIKVGRPAYVVENSDAFLPLDRMVALGLELGAVPTYPVLGNPVTPWEEDLDRLLDCLAIYRIHALEVIPDRNTPERLAEIVDCAAARGLPIVNGTEHNTKEPAPLVDRFFFEPRFRPHFELGARVILGHQALRARGEEGYVRDDGSLPPGDRQAHLERVASAAPTW